MQAELMQEMENWVASRRRTMRAVVICEDLQLLGSEQSAILESDLRALLSRFTLCEKEPVACERCKGQGAVIDTIRLSEGGAVQSIADCDTCNATGSLYAPADIGKEGGE